VFAIFRDFQLDHYEPSILSQRQQIDRSNAELATAGGAKLSVQRCDDQTRIELRDVTPQQ
jgi:hypothetical protein